MDNICSIESLDLLCVIANYGTASRIIKCAKHNGVTGGTVFLGKGTIKNHLLELLDLYETRKEIVLMIAEKKVANNVLDIINKEFRLYKANHGIAFSTSVAGLYGARCYRDNIKESRGEEITMYNAIFVVVDKGSAEDAIEAAVKVGAKGGTIINARGSGIHETNKLFSMEIEPEKEIVMILSDNNNTESITTSISEKLQIDLPGNGIMFVLDLNKTYGLY